MQSKNLIEGKKKKTKLVLQKSKKYRDLQGPKDEQEQNGGSYG